jgi:hypothetical protein
MKIGKTSLNPVTESSPYGDSASVSRVEPHTLLASCRLVSRNFDQTWNGGESRVSAFNGDS